jgi:hypothetical protein
MTLCDKFAIVDHVQFETEGYTNRNSVRSREGQILLTVPVLTSGRPFQRICSVEIDNRRPWARKHWRTIEQNYGRSAYFKDYGPFFRDVYSRPWRLLADLNVAIIRYIMQCLSISVELDFSSRHNVKGQKTDMIIDLCRKLGADSFISGSGGKKYVILDRFQSAGIRHCFAKLAHPTYPQQVEPFIPSLSTIDLLFNCGPESRRILDEAARNSTVEHFSP